MLGVRMVGASSGRRTYPGLNKPAAVDANSCCCRRLACAWTWACSRCDGCPNCPLGWTEWWICCGAAVV